MNKIGAAFQPITDAVFTTKGGMTYADVTRAIIDLCALIQSEETDECTWSIGEYGHCDLGAFIVGAYWHYTEWHAGQASESYAALCALGGIFSPGMSHGPEPETAERDTYQLLADMAGAKP